MNREFTVTPVKSYATLDNAKKTVEKTGDQDIPHFYACTPQGRFFPIFVGQMAINNGIHFRFNVVG